MSVIFLSAHHNCLLLTDVDCYNTIEIEGNCQNTLCKSFLSSFDSQITL